MVAPVGAAPPEPATARAAGAEAPRAEAVEAIIKDLAAADADVRQRAADRAGELGAAAEPAVPALIRLLADDDVGRQMQSRALIVSPSTQAALALGRIGEPALGPLTKALDDDNPMVRNNAAYVLGGFARAGKGLDALLTAATRRDPIVRRQAVMALSTLPDQRAQLAIVAALTDPDDNVRVAAAGTGRGLVETLRREHPHDVNSQLNWVAEGFAKSLNDRHERVRSEAARSLGHFANPIGMPALLKALRDNAAPVRQNAAEALGLIHNRGASFALIDLLGDPDERVRANAARALGELADPVATVPLARLLADRDRNVRISAAGALARIGDRRAVPALCRLLEDEDEQAVRFAAEGLGRIADPSSVEALVKACKAKPGEAKAIADALGELRDPRSIDALGEMLRTRPDAAAPALAKIRHPRAVLVLGDFIAASAPTGAHPWPRAAVRVFEDLTGGGMGTNDETFGAWWKENRPRYERAASESLTP
jgi:HEAT repeat protein